MTEVVPLEVLKPGHWIRTRNGRDAEVLERPFVSASGRGSGVRVAYLEPGPFGTLRRTGEEERLGAAPADRLLGVVPPTTWRERVAVALHYVPESENGPAEYRAETLSGVPNNATISGGDERLSRAALEKLLGSLWLMGFRGTVEVSDGSGDSGGAFQRYEVQVSD